MGVLFWLGPYEPAPLAVRFEESALGNDVDAYLERVESRVPGIRPGAEKRVLWAFPDKRETPLALVYLHGFSASSAEIQPVPDRIAARLGANLVLTRLTGHGRDGAAMGDATVARWMHDTAEALAIARSIGERVVVIGTSTGGTLAVAAASDPQMSRHVAGLILVSPNFGVNSPLAPLLTFPAARIWLPLVAGEERPLEPRSDLQANFWTTRYPVTALLPMAALVQVVGDLDLSQIEVPALFWFSLDDQVVRPDRTEAAAERWGGPITLRTVTMGPGDDPNSHVLTGEALSPGQTDIAIEEMTAWIGALP